MARTLPPQAAAVLSEPGECRPPVGRLGCRHARGERTLDCTPRHLAARLRSRRAGAPAVTGLRSGAESERDGARRTACAMAAPARGPRGRLKKKCAASAGGRTGARGEPPGPLQERRTRATQWSATRPARERVLSPLGIP